MNNESANWKIYFEFPNFTICYSCFATLLKKVLLLTNYALLHPYSLLIGKTSWNPSLAEKRFNWRVSLQAR